MKAYQMGAIESRFADIIWAHEPLSSSQLAAYSLAELGWKKTTSYTVLRRLCDKGLFQNDHRPGFRTGHLVVAGLLCLFVCLDQLLEFVLRLDIEPAFLITHNFLHFLLVLPLQLRSAALRRPLILVRLGVYDLRLLVV